MIVGFDRRINYYKIQYATLCIYENPGCLFIATNLDARTHLTDAQEWAGNGAMVGAIKGAPFLACQSLFGLHPLPFQVFVSACRWPGVGWQRRQRCALLVCVVMVWLCACWYFGAWMGEEAWRPLRQEEPAHAWQQDAALAPQARLNPSTVHAWELVTCLDPDPHSEGTCMPCYGHV